MSGYYEYQDKIYGPTESTERSSLPRGVPGKRSRTADLPPPARRGIAPVQQKRGPGEEAARARQAADTANWMDAAVRPDLHQAPVQRASVGAAHDGVHASPPSAVDGTTKLPSLDRLQESFGHHDLSSIDYVGGTRGAAVAERMGTTALATGGLVVSDSDEPSVVAHEAAHVVLQRGSVTHGSEAEARANQVAAVAARGQSVEAMLDEVVAPGAANAPMDTVDPMKKNGVPVDIATLSPRAVLMALDTVGRYGEPGIAGDTEYEVGDTAALDARRRAPGFAAGEIANLTGLLTGGHAAVAAVATHRHLAVSLPAFQAIFVRLSADPRVVGLDEWVVMNSVYLDMLQAGPPAAFGGAEQLLDALNELRTLDIVLASMSPTDILDVREIAIPGTTQTADGTVMDATGAITKQIEVKTVRQPIGYQQLADVKSQVGAGLGKFANAGPGNYEVQVFAAYSEVAPVTKPMGPFTRTEAINRDTHAFERTSTKPGYDQTTSVRAELLSYLNGAHRDNPTLRVVVTIENTSTGPDDLTFSHPGASTDWT